MTTTPPADEPRIVAVSEPLDVATFDVAKVFLTLERVQLTETALEALIIWLDDEYGNEAVKG